MEIGWRQSWRQLLVIPKQHKQPMAERIIALRYSVNNNLSVKIV